MAVTPCEPHARYLGRNGLPDGAIAAAALPQLSSLRVLDLSDNKVRGCGVPCFAASSGVQSRDTLMGASVPQRKGAHEWRFVACG